MRKYVVILFVLLLLTSFVLADIPKNQTSQIILRNKTTNQTMVGTYNINYSLISGSSIVWNETISTALDNGIASNTLGIQTPLTYNLFLDNPYVRVNIDSGGNVEYSLTTYPYAFIAQFALSVNWTNISGKPLNLDTDTTDDYKTTNFTTDYYAITSRYGNSNFTTQYYTLADRYGNSNFTTQYYTLADRYGNSNFTTQYYAITSRYTDDNLTASEIYAKTPHTNRTDSDIANAVQNNTILRNLTDSYFGRTNLTVHLIIQNDTNWAKIWHNGSGICIGAC